ncbi:MAG: hypothetical protein ABSA91_19785, partial [Acidimicrobiales bacterium]
MSVRDGKAQGVALAGVAAIGLLVGGMVFVRSAGTSAGVPVKAVLNGSAPRWADGYNHFILTMSGPVPLVGDGSVAKRSAAPTPAGARTEAGRAAQVPSRLGAASASVRLSAANAPGVVTRGAHSAQGSAGAQSGPGPQSARSSQGPSQQDGIPWQAVPPNAANPIVWRPGEPVSVLARNLARYPKGTTLQRDSEGNIRAVLPPGANLAPPPPPGRSRGSRPVVSVPSRSGHPAVIVPSKRPAAAAHGRYPPGWGPDSQAIANSLLNVP